MKLPYRRNERFSPAQGDRCRQLSIIPLTTITIAIALTAISEMSSQEKQIQGGEVSPLAPKPSVSPLPPSAGGPEPPRNAPPLRPPFHLEPWWTRQRGSPSPNPPPLLER